MNAIKNILVLVLAIVGTLLINHYFNNKKEAQTPVNTFSNDYTLVDTNNKFETKSIDEILSILDKGTGIVFMCTPNSSWCQSYAFQLNEIIKNTNIENVYYIDITSDRDLNSNKYKKLLNKLDNYLLRNDQNNSTINMPDLTFVKDGVIIAHDDDTSLVKSNETPLSYWTSDTIELFKNKINSYIELLNKEELE